MTEAQQRRAHAQFGKIFKVAIHCVGTSHQGVDEHISARAHAKSTARLDPLFHCHILEHEDGGDDGDYPRAPWSSREEAPKARSIPAKTTRREVGIVKLVSRREARV